MENINIDYLCKELRDVHVNNMPTDRYLRVLLYE